MNNSTLLNEALTLLKEIKSENGNTDSSISERRLEQAISNLEKIQGCSERENRTAILKVLGKLLDNIPEIKELLEFLAEL